MPVVNSSASSRFSASAKHVSSRAASSEHLRPSDSGSPGSLSPLSETSDPFVGCFVARVRLSSTTRFANAYLAISWWWLNAVGTSRGTGGSKKHGSDEITARTHAEKRDRMSKRRPGEECERLTRRQAAGQRRPHAEVRCGEVSWEVREVGRIVELASSDKPLFDEKDVDPPLGEPERHRFADADALRADEDGALVGRGRGRGALDRIVGTRARSSWLMPRSDRLEATAGRVELDRIHRRSEAMSEREAGVACQ